MLLSTAITNSGIGGMVARLAVGKLKQSGQCVIYYDVRKISLD